MHVLQIMSGLMVMLRTASATLYCRCMQADNVSTHSGINAVCRQTGDNWCTTNCNPVGKDCSYCQYKPAGDPDRRYDQDYQDLERWCMGQYTYDHRGKIHFGYLTCTRRNLITECPTCTGCSYYDNDSVDVLRAHSNQDLLTVQRSSQGPAVTLMPLGAGMGYQCLGITVDVATAVAHALADRFKACKMSQVDVDRYEVDCDTPEAVECMGGKADELAVVFGEICAMHDGEATEIDRVS